MARMFGSGDFILYIGIIYCFLCLHRQVCGLSGGIDLPGVSTVQGNFGGSRVLVHLRSGPILSENNDRQDSWTYDQARRRLRMNGQQRGSSSLRSFLDPVATRSLDWGWLKNTRQALIGAHDHDSHDLIDHLEECGCRIAGFYGNGSMLVVGSAEALEAGLDHDHISWTVPYESENKIAPEWDTIVSSMKNVTPGEAPVDVMYSATGEALYGVRAVFPALHRPRAHHPDNERHKHQQRRIDRWEQENRHRSSMAAMKDWRKSIARDFDTAHLEQNGKDAIRLYVPFKDIKRAIRWLSERNVVHWVEPVPKLKLMNRQASSITQSGLPAPNTNGQINIDPKFHPVWSSGITGKGMVIGIGDSGLDYKHCFFSDPDTDWQANVVTVDRVLTFTSETHRKIRLYRAFADFQDSNGHGTHTCGTLAGIPYGNTVAETSGVNIGMAPEAKLAFIDLSSMRDGERIVTPGDLANDYFRYTAEVGATVHSDSWGSTNIYYDYESYQIDKYCWENPVFLPVFAAGNDGDRLTASGSSGTSTVNSPATAKNCLAVGATNTAGMRADMSTTYETFTTTTYINGVKSSTFPILLSSFSPSFSSLENAQYNLVISNPLDACSPLMNAADIVGKIVLIERGTCEFVQKSKYAEQAGAAGVIIYDNLAGAYFKPDTNGDTVSIPVGFIPRRIGQNLVAAIKSGRTLTVSLGPGASGDIGYENQASFSSQGPVQPDRRIKPDIVAPGVVTSARAGTSCSEATFAGTSMATPVTAGSVALIQQYFKEGFYPTGVSIPENGFMPTSALVKAVMMGGAKQITGYEEDTGLPIDPAPSFRQGYGRVYLGGSLQLQNNPYNPKGFQVLNSVDIVNGEKHVYCVNSNGGPLSITVAWTDYPGNPSSRRSLTNNIDLVVKAEGYNGVPTLGNGGDIDDSSKADDVNNVEQVRFDFLPAGRVSIEVIGTEIYSNQLGPQPYALVVNGDFEGTLVEPTGSQQECPVISAKITNGPGPLTNKDPVTFEFSLSGGNSGGASFECKLEPVENGEALQAPWSPCVSPQQYPSLPDAEFIFSVRPVGENSVATQTFVMDRTPPKLEVTSMDSPRGLPAFQIQATDFTETTVECMVSGEGLSAAQGPVKAGEVVPSSITIGEWFDCSSQLTLGWLLPGQWTLSTRATDKAGNVSPTDEKQLLAPNDPNTPLVYIKQGPFLTIPKSEVSFETIVLSGGQASNQQTECSLLRWPTEVQDPGFPQSWEACSQIQQYGVLDNGKYSYYSRIAGAPTETAAFSSFTVDEIAPTVNVVGNPKFFTTTEATFQFEVSESGKTECKLTGIDHPEDSIDWAPCQQPVQFQNLTGGRYTFDVVATDAVGNRGEPVSTEFTVDLEPPVVTVNYPEGTRDSKMTVTFTADDGKGSGVGNITCQLIPIKLVGKQVDEKSDLYDPRPCESPWTFDLEEGEWQISIVATDNSGQSSVGKPLSIWMDTVPPTATITGGPSKTEVNSGGTAVFNITDDTIENGGSPVLWQGYLSMTSTSIEDQQPPSSSPGNGDPTVKTVSSHALRSIASEQNILGPGDLDKWANCSTTSCTYEGLKQGTYTFITKGVDAAGNIGDPSQPYRFKMEGASSGLPTWALIVIIAGSAVVGILLIAVLWCCCCRKSRPSPQRLNGAVTPYNNTYAMPNTNVYGQTFTPHYSYGATYPVAGARPFVGALPPTDPVAAQAQELNRYRRGVDEDDEMKMAIEESKKLSQGGSSNDDVEDIDLAIALSLSHVPEEDNRVNMWR